MSYLVLARKYRPAGFDDFVGQEVIGGTLRNAIRLADGHVDINPDDVDALTTLMVAYASIGDSERFQSFKNGILEVSATDPQIQYSVAVSASRLGNMEASKLHAQRAYDLGFPGAPLRADPDIAASGASFD